MSAILRLIPNFPEYGQTFDRLGPSGYTIILNIYHTTPEAWYSTLPTDWVDEYTEKSYAFADPVMQFTMFSTGVKRWDEIQHFKLPVLSKKVYERACFFNLNYGGAVVKKSSEGGRKKHLFSFARSDRQATDEELREASDTFNKFIEQYEAGETFTDRQIKILIRLAQGLTRSDVAKEIGRSDGTVRDEIREIRFKLGNAENIPQAVAMALSRHIIEPEDIYPPI